MLEVTKVKSNPFSNELLTEINYFLIRIEMPLLWFVFATLTLNNGRQSRILLIISNYISCMKIYATKSTCFTLLYEKLS